MNGVLALQCSLLLLAGSQTEKKQTVEDSWTHVHAAKEQVRIVKMVAEIMTTVSDKNTAATGIDKLKMLRKDSLAYWLRSQKLLETTEELDAKFQREGEAASNLFRSEVTRIKTVQGGAGVRQEIQALFLAMMRGCESGEKLNWRWSDEKADLAYSIKKHLENCDMEVVRETQYTPISIRDKRERRAIYSPNGPFKNDLYFVFSRWKGTLYIAEHNTIATGCTVVALDLKTGKTLWRSRLFGTGPTPIMHSKYSNAINIETDGKRIIIFGREDDGRYVECLDINTGVTLANQRFDSDPE